MTIKLFFAVASVVVLIVGYVPYFRDIFRKTTKPHAYTWLIWAITTGTATAAAFYGGANWGTMGLAGSTFITILVFLLSFKYGTKNITRSDMFVLILALSAIVVWWLTNNLLLSVLMVTAIDGIAYVPTLRKSWEEPYSETLSFWLIMTMVNMLTILSLGEINWITAPYLVVPAILNVFVLTICIFRRRFVKKL